MAQFLSQLWAHLIFSTKNRFPFLSDPEVRFRVHAYLGTILRNQDCSMSVVGGTQDHVHALLTPSRKYAMADIGKEAKRSSSSWIKTLSPGYPKFQWQNGYAVFSVSQSHVDQVRRYIEKEEEHHRRITFQEEYRAFLKKYNVAYDERYVCLGELFQSSLLFFNSVNPG